MSYQFLRVVLPIPGIIAVVISAFAFGRSEWGEFLVIVLRREDVYLLIATIAAGLVVWMTIYSQATLAVILGALHLPGVASHSSLDWANLAGWKVILPAPDVSPWTTTILVMITAVLFVIAARIAQEFDDRNVDLADLEQTDFNSYVAGNTNVMARVVGGATGATLIAVAVALALTSGPLRDETTSWPIVIFGLAAVLIVSLVVYSLKLAWGSLVQADDPPPADDAAGPRERRSTLIDRLNDGADRTEGR